MAHGIVGRGRPNSARHWSQTGAAVEWWRTRFDGGGPAGILSRRHLNLTMTLRVVVVVAVN